MTRKKAAGKAVRAEKTATTKEAAAERAAAPEPDRGASADAPKAHVTRAKPKRRRQPMTQPNAVPRRSTVSAAVAPGNVERAVAGLRGEIRALTDVVHQFIAPVPAPVKAGRAPGAADEALEGAVDSLRRLLSDLIEQRMESVVGHLAEVRREAAALAAGGQGTMVERVDDLLETLGAVRFEAEPMDVVDPLIHVVLEERRDAGAPDGVILEALRPGYRTGRGLVVCKAAVAVNRRS